MLKIGKNMPVKRSEAKRLVSLHFDRRLHGIYLKDVHRLKLAQAKAFISSGEVSTLLHEESLLRGVSPKELADIVVKKSITKTEEWITVLEIERQQALALIRESKTPDDLIIILERFSQIESRQDEDKEFSR